MDLWEDPYTVPLQDIGGKLVAGETLLKQPPKPSEIAGIKSELMHISALSGDKDW